ncbi:MAG TPA: hypothetical protein VD769_08730 [Gaiellaceae bacterium]|nr:hypothetical protein [Gaiellaceae bacterium]
MARRLLALTLLAFGAAAFFASRQRHAARYASHNGGSREQAAQLRRELERT